MTAYRVKGESWNFAKNQTEPDVLINSASPHQNSHYLTGFSLKGNTKIEPLQ